MSDICESCGCPEGVDGHDVLYRQINELKEAVNKGNGINNLASAIGTMDAEERSMLCARITKLEDALRKIDAMRKRLPDPDFAEQKNTAAGIAEIVQSALTQKDECTCGHGGFFKGLHGIECPVRG